MFCQACGAKNAERARFCSQCGVAIARAVPRGGASRPAPQRAPPLHDTADFELTLAGVTLSAMGVRSQRRVWATLAAGIFALVLVSVGVTWLVMRQAPAAVVAADRPAEPEAAPHLTIGPALPTGADLPGDDFLAVPTLAQRSAASAPPAAAPQAAPTAKASAAQQPKVATLPVGADLPPLRKTRRRPAARPAPKPAPAAPVKRPEPEPDEAPPPSGGSYSSRVAQVVNQRYAARAESCFERASRTHPGMRGSAIIAFTIAAQGQVSGSRIIIDTTGAAKVGSCLTREIRSWRFPPPPDGRAVELTVPFLR